MLRVSLIAILLLACGERYPVDEDLPKVYNQDKAMLWFEGLVENSYEIKLGNLFESAQPLWVSENDCYWRDTPGIEYKGQCVAGVTFSCSEMYVFIDREEKSVEELRTHSTALLHEFGHCVRLELGWGGDGAHTDEEFWGLVEQAREYSKNRDW